MIEIKLSGEAQFKDLRKQAEVRNDTLLSHRWSRSSLNHFCLPPEYGLSEAIHWRWCRGEISKLYRRQLRYEPICTENPQTRGKRLLDLTERGWFERFFPKCGLSCLKQQDEERTWKRSNGACPRKENSPTVKWVHAAYKYSRSTTTAYCGVSL